MRIVLALGERDPDSLDFYAGPPAWLADARAARTPLAEIKRSATALLDRIVQEHPAKPEDEARRQFLIGQLRAVRARIDILSGTRMAFDDESRLLFGVDVPDRDRAAFEGVRREADRMLPGSGSVARRYAEFDHRFVIPRDRLPAVMARAIDGCRRVTLQHLALPEGERVTVEYVRGMPWSAFTKYEGHGHSRIQINIDFDLAVDRALQLACHEAYPGHHAIETLIDARIVGPRQWLERAVLPRFSPQSMRTEGAATFAPELAFPDADRLAFERDELFPLAGLNPADAESHVRLSRLVDRLRWLQADIARRYLDGSLEFARAASALEEEALMPTADATLKFLNEFRTYAVTYTLGPEIVARYVGRGESRWRAYERWVTETR